MDLLDSIAWGCHRPYPKLSEYEVIVTSQFKVWTTSPIVQPQYKKGLHEARDSDISHAIEKTSSAWYDLKGKGKSSNVSFLLSHLSTVATNRKGIAVSFLCNIAACQFKQRFELDWNNPAWLCRVMNILQCLCCKKKYWVLYSVFLIYHSGIIHKMYTKRRTYIFAGSRWKHAACTNTGLPFYGIYRNPTCSSRNYCIYIYLNLCVCACICVSVYSTLGQAFECVNRQPQPWN